MSASSAESSSERHVLSQDVRPLDDTDLAILRVLGSDARVSNKELAERVGVAQSTCLARVRALRESGVIRAVEERAFGIGTERFDA